MDKILQQYVDEFKSELDEIKSEYFEFPFNINQLPNTIEYTRNKDITTHDDFKTTFDKLKGLYTNCLYWFSVNSIENANKLKEIISVKRVELFSNDTEKCRILPATNNNIDSKVIYVGVRKGGIIKKDNSSFITGRIVQHLGYYEKGKTQGLQLAYYKDSLDINLTLHVHSLSNCPDEYLYVLEKIFAKKLKPLCGKH